MPFSPSMNSRSFAQSERDWSNLFLSDDFWVVIKWGLALPIIQHSSLMEKIAMNSEPDKSNDTFLITRSFMLHDHTCFPHPAQNLPPLEAAPQFAQNFAAEEAVWPSVGGAAMIRFYKGDTVHGSVPTVRAQGTTASSEAISTDSEICSMASFTIRHSFNVRSSPLNTCENQSSKRNYRRDLILFPIGSLHCLKSFNPWMHYTWCTWNKPYASFCRAHSLFRWDTPSSHIFHIYPFRITFCSFERGMGELS